MHIDLPPDLHLGRFCFDAENRNYTRVHFRFSAFAFETSDLLWTLSDLDEKRFCICLLLGTLKHSPIPFFLIFFNFFFIRIVIGQYVFLCMLFGLSQDVADIRNCFVFPLCLGWNENPLVDGIRLSNWVSLQVADSKLAQPQIWEWNRPVLRRDLNESLKGTQWHDQAPNRAWWNPQGIPHKHPQSKEGGHNQRETEQLFYWIMKDNPPQGVNTYLYIQDGMCLPKFPIHHTF